MSIENIFDWPDAPTHTIETQEIPKHSAILYNDAPISGEVISRTFLSSEVIT